MCSDPRSPFSSCYLLSVSWEPLHRQTALLERAGYALYSDTAKGGWHKAKGELLSEGLKCQQRCCTALQSPDLLCIKTEQMLVGLELCHIQSRPWRTGQSLLRWHKGHCPGFSVPAFPWMWGSLQAMSGALPCLRRWDSCNHAVHPWAWFMSHSLLALTLLVSCSGVPQKHKGSEVISSCIPCENRQLGGGKGPRWCLCRGKDIDSLFIRREFGHRET